MKIIHILCHPINYDRYNIYGNWAFRMANFMKNNDNISRQKVFYPANNLKRIKSINLANNIEIKLFPTKTFHIFKSLIIPTFECNTLLKELKKNENYGYTLYVHGEKSSLVYQISKLTNYKKAIHFHGYGRKGIYSLLYKLFIKKNEIKYLNNYEHIFCGIKYLYENLIENVKINKTKLSYYNYPVDKNKFLRKINRNENSLSNIVKNKIVIITIGFPSKNKGFDKNIEFARKLKKICNDYFIIHVSNILNKDINNLSFWEKKILGIYNPKDYQNKNSIDLCLEKIPNDELNKLLNQSNIYIHFGNKLKDDFSGIGVAVTEALFCKLIVFSNTLKHIPSFKENKFGYTFKNTTDLINKIILLKKKKNMILGSVQYKKILNYYSSDSLIPKIISKL